MHKVCGETGRGVFNDVLNKCLLPCADALNVELASYLPILELPIEHLPLPYIRVTILHMITIDKRASNQ